MRKAAAPKTLALDAADRLRADILGGRLAPGTTLPGERELSETLGVSRLTLRAALARLEGEGLVRPVHGSGTRVLDFRESGGVELLGHLLALPQRDGSLPLSMLADLLELRRLVAVEVIALVTARASDAELDGLEAHVERQATLVGGEPAAYVESDLALGRLLVRASHNLGLELLANTISKVIEAQPGIEAAFLVNPEGALAVYRRIVRLARGRDEARARRSARLLIARLDRVLLARLELLLGGGA